MSNSLLKKTQQKMYEVFGFSEFLPGQESILADILEGKDVVAIMPTGSGKSLLYQLPALVFEGCVIVISPLISLMKDQVDSLVQKDIRAACINSSLSNSEKQRVMQNMVIGCYDLIYIAPERLQHEQFQQTLKNTKVSMIAVDEAHCISQWGHDFRPDYLKIKDIREILNAPQTIALTATATKEVRGEIAERLSLKKWCDHIAGFDRDNLYFAVHPVSGQAEKIRCIADICQKTDGCGIIYAGTRKNVQYVVQEMRKLKFSIAAYHAGMEDHERTAVQNHFMDEKFRIVTATNAFGMGINKANIRFVIHFDIPSNIEAYYQEIGRAGRDRKEAQCFLLFNYADTRIPRFFINESHPDPTMIEKLIKLISPLSVIPMLEDIESQIGASSIMTVRYALTILERAGLIARAYPGDFYVNTFNQEGFDKLSQILHADQQRKQHEEQKLSQMIRYAYIQGCRRSWILDYFGDAKEHAKCNACDNCKKLSLQQEITGEKYIEVLKALSALARLNGKLGKTKLAQVLTGSKSNAIIKLGFDKIPTYGALEYLPQNKVYKLLDNLIESGYVEIRLKDGQYPLLKITTSGIDVMMKKEPAFLSQRDWPGNEELYPKKKSIGKKNSDKKQPKKKSVSQYDNELYDKLSTTRKLIAKERKIAPYLVFHNSTLQELAGKQPTTLKEMSQISGIGKVKLESYGEQILEVICSYKNTPITSKG